MVELLIELICVVGCTCFMSLCVKPKELKSDRRMPVSNEKMQNESLKEKSGVPSSISDLSAEHLQTCQKNRAALRDRRKKFNKEASGRWVSLHCGELKSIEEVTDIKSAENGEKAEQDRSKKSRRKDGAPVVRTDRTVSEKSERKTDRKRSASDTTLLAAKTQDTETRSFSLSHEAFTREERECKGSPGAVAVPRDTLALLEAAEHMVHDKDDYVNFGPPQKVGE
ncbi:hypothetical protein RB195_016462 [Necator americanus]|uniref:BZIP domain-containing protein n=1 Tax=Necator americanus TaxID=51031 RepID=A0ABR1C0J3_NECAM